MSYISEEKILKDVIFWLLSEEFGKVIVECILSLIPNVPLDKLKAT